MSENRTESTTPELLWTAELGQNASQPPLVLGDILLVATQPSGRDVHESQLQAVELSSGKLLWQHPYPHSMISGMQACRLAADRRPVAVISRRGRIPTSDGGVQALCERGEIDWSWRAAEQTYSAPAVSGYEVFVIAGSRSLIAVCPEEEGLCNEQRIQFEAKASLNAPAIQDGVAYIPCRSPDILALGLQGEVQWHFHLESEKLVWLDKTPLLSGNQLFTVSSLGSLLAIDTTAGTMLWRTTIGEGRPLSQPVMAGDQIYVGSRQGVSAIDKRNGSLLWSFATSRPVSAAPLVSGDRLYFASEDHHLYAVNVENGDELWRHKMARRIEMPPVQSSAGALVVADRGGNLVAFDVPAPATTRATPAGQDPVVVTAFQRQTAEEHERQDEPLAAAHVWRELGELERAAEQFELAEAWLEAAELWLQMDRYGKRAQALRRHARALSKQETVDDEQKAAAWEQAARAYAETGQRELRIQCEQEVARFRRQPILELEVAPVELTMGAWSKLNYTITNKGFGVARHVDLILKGDQFDGQEARTRTVVTLTPGQSHTHWIDVSPKSHGTSVPMQLSVEYIDKSSKIHVLDKLENYPVAGPTSPLTGTAWTQTGMGPDTASLLAQLPSPGGRDLRELRDKLVRSFSRDELRYVISDLNLLDDNFDDRRSFAVTELIELLARHGRLEELIHIVQRERPKEDW